MESNTYSSRRPDGLAALAAAVDELAARDLGGLANVALGPRRSWPCGGCWIAWKASGPRNW
ncbi:MAG TPA: hypothetical protein VG846_06150, partial [Actinomycetota bacterium]|nr:hypothetical protein [Actinomycetota bacterium]